CYPFLVFFMTSLPPGHTLFPYTTLFRSYIHAEKGNGEEEAREQDQIRLDLKVHTPLRHHVAPGRNVQGETRPEKAQSGFCKHCRDRKSTRLNSSHVKSSYAVFWLKKKNY